MNELEVADYGTIEVKCFTDNGVEKQSVPAVIIHRNYNPCFDYIVTGPNLPNLVGPMFDGNYAVTSFGRLMIMDRYESVDMYDRMSR